MEKISIIIPVYNVENYIEKCLDSIIKQTHTNLEILCIDDGSTDNSGKICDEYAAKDNRIIVFHQENQGVSAARNVGLRSFTGQYVGFVDPDDWTEPNMYEILYRLVKGNNASVGIVNYFIDTDIESVEIVNKIPIPDGIMSHKDLASAYSPGRRGFQANIWNKIFSREFFEYNDIFFDETYRRGSDTLFYMTTILSRKCIGAYTDKHLYHYNIRNSSITNSSPMDTRTYQLTLYRKIIDLLISNDYEDLSVWVKREHCYNSGLHAEWALKTNDREALKFTQNEIRRYLREYLEINKEYPDRIEWINNLLNS